MRLMISADVPVHAAASFVLKVNVFMMLL